MNRRTAIASALLLAATAMQAAPISRSLRSPGPDFWYVMPAGAEGTATSRFVRGIVVPSSVSPTVRTTPSGSVISWQRLDGTTQSFVVHGVSSFTFEPGPLKGTTYVPFAKRKLLQYDPDSCCACASWNNMEESFEQMTCVAGCTGCGCEACICSPSSPCPQSARHGMTLVPHNSPAGVMTFDESDVANGITIAGPGRSAVTFAGARLSASVSSTGQTQIDNPDSIELPGTVVTNAVVRGDKAMFAWSSPDASIILEQPRSMPAPSFEGGTIHLETPPAEPPATAVSRIHISPVMDRCRVCGTHPNSSGDTDLMMCVPGDSVCYRCISWECSAS